MTDNKELRLKKGKRRKNVNQKEYYAERWQRHKAPRKSNRVWREKRHER